MISGRTSCLKPRQAQGQEQHLPDQAEVGPQSVTARVFDDDRWAALPASKGMIGPSMVVALLVPLLWSCVSCLFCLVCFRSKLSGGVCVVGDRWCGFCSLGVLHLRLASLAERLAAARFRVCAFRVPRGGSDKEFAIFFLPVSSIPMFPQKPIVGFLWDRGPGVPVGVGRPGQKFQDGRSREL